MVRALFVLSLLFSSAPVTAQVLFQPVPEDFAPRDQRLVVEALQALASVKDGESALSVIAALQEKHRDDPRAPLIFGGIRAQALLGLNRKDEARALVADVIKRYPDDPIATSFSANFHYIADEYRKAAEDVITTVKADMSWANKLNNYDARILFDQLGMAKENAVSARLAQRLFDAGWTKGGIGLRSSIAANLMEELLEQGKVDDARRYVLHIGDPSDLAAVLIDNRYRAVHDTIREWAGDRLQLQWPIYLSEAKADFRRLGDATSAWEYANALSLANRDGAIIEEVLPVALKQWDETKDEEWLFPVVVAGGALVRLGRWDEAFALYDLAEKDIHPESPNKLNFQSSRAYYTMAKGDYAAASRYYDQVMAATKGNNFVSKPALARLTAHTICARYKSGAPSAAEAAEAARQWTATAPNQMAIMWTCLGEPAKARQAWLTAIVDPERRRSLLAFVQPSDEARLRTPFTIAMEEAMEKLRADPELRAAVADIGTIRSWSLRSSAPAN